jgi:hypothetical protein
MNDEKLYTLAELAELVDENYNRVRWAHLKGVISPIKKYGRTQLFHCDQVDVLKEHFREKREAEDNEPPCSVLMPFGKFAGRPINKIQKPYLAWVVENCDLSNQLRADIQCVLSGMPLPERRPSPTLNERLEIAMGRK